MKLYQNNNQNQNTWIYFYLHGAVGNEFLDYNLPLPNYLLHSNAGVYIGWLVNGFPGTKESREYFNDIIARFLVSQKENRPERLEYNPNIIGNKGRALIDLKNSYELSQFQNLPSISTNKEIWTAESVGTVDQIFWAIKL